MKSTATVPPQPGQSVRISRTSVTTRSSSSGVVIPAFTFDRPSSPSVTIPEPMALSRSMSSLAFCAIRRRIRSVIRISSWIAIRPW